MSEMILEEVRKKIAEFKYERAEMRWCQSDCECGGWDEVQSDWEEGVLERPSDEYLASEDNKNAWCGYRQILCWLEVTKRDDGSEFLWWHACPRWATDISAAWELVEEMLSANKRPKLARVAEKEWLFEVCKVPDCFAYASTAPLAICLAYIAWKEGTK